MTHARQLIREAMAAAIGAVPALVGRVETTRTRPSTPDDLPSAIIYTLSEASEPASVGGGLRRTLSAAIELRVKAADDLDDALDALCEPVEAAMADDVRLGHTALNSFLAGTAITLDGEGENRMALATLTYTVTYQT